jgi:hypothetical protein
VLLRRLIEPRRSAAVGRRRAVALGGRGAATDPAGAVAEEHGVVAGARNGEAVGLDDAEGAVDDVEAGDQRGVDGRAAGGGAAANAQVRP